MGWEVAHWEHIADIRIMRNKLAQQEAIAAGQSPVPEQDAPTERSPVHVLVVAQMRACIAGAVAQISGMAQDADTRFQVTLNGYVDLDPTDGIEARTQVFVDRAPMPRNGWPKE